MRQTPNGPALTALFHALLALIVLVLSAPAASADALDDAVAAIKGVGFGIDNRMSSSILPADESHLRVILTAPDARVDQWLTGTPKQISAALLVLDDRGQVNRLASLTHLFGDTRPAIPLVGMWSRQPLDDADYYEDRTIDAHYALTLQKWLGASIPADVARYQAMYANVTDFNNLPGPWINRLVKAKNANDPALLASIKQQVAALDPDIRWVVIAKTSNPKDYNNDPPIPVAEARSMMQALPAAKKAALAGDAVVIPPDPKYDGPKSANLPYIRSLAKQLLAEAP